MQGLRGSKYVFWQATAFVQTFAHRQFEVVFNRGSQASFKHISKQAADGPHVDAAAKDVIVSVDNEELGCHA